MFGSILVNLSIFFCNFHGFIYHVDILQQCNEYKIQQFYLQRSTKFYQWCQGFAEPRFKIFFYCHNCLYRGIQTEWNFLNQNPYLFYSLPDVSICPFNSMYWNNLAANLKKITTRENAVMTHYSLTHIIFARWVCASSFVHDATAQLMYIAKKKKKYHPWRHAACMSFALVWNWLNMTCICTTRKERTILLDIIA